MERLQLYISYIILHFLVTVYRLPVHGAQATRLLAHLPLVAVAHGAAVPGGVPVVAGVGGVGHVVRGVGAQSAALAGHTV